MRSMVWLTAIFLLQGCARYDSGQEPDAQVTDDGEPAGQDGDPFDWQDDDAPPADDGELMPDDDCPDGGCDAGGPGIYPACEERGGRCTWVDDLDATCPDGTYNPFSGHLRMCPTGSIQLCCVPAGGLGSPCTLERACDNGGCLPEQSGYPPGGFCGQICDPFLDPTGCPAWATCLTVYFSAAMGMCLSACQQDEHCREGWSCQAFPTSLWEPDQGSSYVCWDAGGAMSGLGLGQACAVDEDCLSMLCLSDLDGQKRCAAVCDDAHPCLTGYACRSTQGMRACFPE